MIYTIIMDININQEENKEYEILLKTKTKIENYLNTFIS